MFKRLYHWLIIFRRCEWCDRWHHGTKIVYPLPYHHPFRACDDCHARVSAMLKEADRG